MWSRDRVEMGYRCIKGSEKREWIQCLNISVGDRSRLGVKWVHCTMKVKQALTKRVATYDNFQLEMVAKNCFNGKTLSECFDWLVKQPRQVKLFIFTESNSKILCSAFKPTNNNNNSIYLISFNRSLQAVSYPMTTLH